MGMRTVRLWSRSMQHRELSMCVQQHALVISKYRACRTSF